MEIYGEIQRTGKTSRVFKNLVGGNHYTDISFSLKANSNELIELKHRLMQYLEGKGYLKKIITIHEKGPAVNYKHPKFTLSIEPHNDIANVFIKGEDAEDIETAITRLVSKEGEKSLESLLKEGQ